jgi:hypothetical protein
MRRLLGTETKLAVKKKDNMGCKSKSFILLVDENRKVRVVNNGLIFCNDYRNLVNVHFVLLITVIDLFLSSFVIN